MDLPVLPLFSFGTAQAAADETVVTRLLSARQAPVTPRLSVNVPTALLDEAARPADEIASREVVVHAEEIAEEFPVVGIDSPALEAARMLAEHRQPGIVVVTADRQPYAVLPAKKYSLSETP